MKPLAANEQEQIDYIFARATGIKFFALIDFLKEMQPGPVVSRYALWNVVSDLCDMLAKYKINFNVGMLSILAGNGLLVVLYEDSTYAEGAREEAVAKVIWAIESVIAQHAVAMKAEIEKIISKIHPELRRMLLSKIEVDASAQTSELLSLFSRSVPASTTEIAVALAMEPIPRLSLAAIKRTSEKLAESLSDWQQTFQFLTEEVGELSEVAKTARTEIIYLDVLIGFFQGVTEGIESLQLQLIDLISSSDRYCRHLDAAFKVQCFTDITRQLIDFFPDVERIDVGLITVLVQILHVRAEVMDTPARDYGSMYSELREAVRTYFYDNPSTRIAALMEVVQRVTGNLCTLDAECIKVIDESQSQLRGLIVSGKLGSCPAPFQVAAASGTELSDGLQAMNLGK